MDEDGLDRDRMAFAAGLLAILFALSPAYSALDRIRVPIFGDDFRLSYGYITFAVTLGMAVYAYGLSLLSASRDKTFRKVGNALFVVALLCPPAFLGTFVVGIVQSALIPDPETARGAGKTTALVMAGLTFVALVLMRRQLEIRDVVRKNAAAERRARTLLARAVELYRAGFYEHALIEAANAIVAGAEGRVASANSGVRPRSAGEVYAWLLGQTQLNIPDLGPQLEALRDLRNQAAHGRAVVSKERCQSLLETAGRVVDAVSLMAQRTARPKDVHVSY